MFNSITMKLQADHLIMEALKEDISSEDVSTNSVMKQAVKGTVDLLCKEDRNHWQAWMCLSGYLSFWTRPQSANFSVQTETR